MEDKNVKEKIEKIIKEYLTNEEWYLRIREKDNQIIFYKNGRKIIELRNNNIYCSNIPMFVLNSKNIGLIDFEKEKDFKDKYVIQKITQSIDELLEIGFEVKKCNNKKIIASIMLSNSKLNKTDEEKKELFKKMSLKLEKKLKEQFKNDDYSFEYNEKRINDKILVGREIESQKIIDEKSYIKYLELCKVCMDITNEDENFKQIKFNNSLAIKQEKFIENYKKIFEIFEDAVKNYDVILKMNANKNKKITMEELEKKAIQAYNDESSEKIYQQKIINQFNKCTENKISGVKNCENIDGVANDESFELEYYLYDYINEKPNIGTYKGRIDCIFVRGTELILCEVKYDTGVIDGTNGIHKHLHDVNYCLDSKTKRDRALNQIKEYIKYRNQYINDIDKTIELENIKNIEKFKFVIICGYSSESKKEEVKNKIKEIYNLNFEEILKTKKVKKIKEKIKEGYNKSVNDYIVDMKTYCEVEIYVANDELSKIERI